MNISGDESSYMMDDSYSNPISDNAKSYKKSTFKPDQPLSQSDMREFPFGKKNEGQEEAKFKNPFESAEPEKPSPGDPFAPNPALSMKDPYSMGAGRDPFGGPKEQFAIVTLPTKDPFGNPAQSKNPFETGGQVKSETAFKDSKLTLGLKSLNSQPRPQQTAPIMHPFKTNMASPSAVMYFNNMDPGTGKAAIISQYPRGGMYPMMSPSAFTPSRNQYNQYNRGTGRARDLPSSPGMFQTPTSKGYMSAKKDETGSFGVSPKDISTTKAVFNQQTNIHKEYEVLTPTQQQHLKPMMVSNFFASSPAYGNSMNHNPFGVNYGNTPTGGSFGASPAHGWFFNNASPNTGTAQNLVSPFTNVQMQEVQQNDQGQQEHSPKFNSIPDSSNRHNPGSARG